MKNWKRLAAVHRSPFHDKLGHEKIPADTPAIEREYRFKIREYMKSFVGLKNTARIRWKAKERIKKLIRLWLTIHPPFHHNCRYLLEPLDPDS